MDVYVLFRLEGVRFCLYEHICVCTINKKKRVVFYILKDMYFSYLFTAKRIVIKQKPNTHNAIAEDNDVCL